MRRSSLSTGKPKPESFPNIDAAVQREFQALREFLVEIEQTPSNGNGKSNGATIVMPSSNGKPRAWWVILRGIERLPVVTDVRERIARLPGCMAAQVVSLSSSEIRLSVTTSCQIDERQLEFVVGACNDVRESQIIARSMRPVD
jgi:hypothetical protein